MWLGVHAAAVAMLWCFHVARRWAAMERQLTQARHTTDQQQRAADLGTLDALPCDVLERIQQLVVQRRTGGDGRGGEVYAG